MCEMYLIDWELFFPLFWFPKESEQFECVEKNRFPKTSYKGIVCIKLNISRLKQKTYFKRPKMQTE